MVDGSKPKLTKPQRLQKTSLRDTIQEVREFQGKKPKVEQPIAPVETPKEEVKVEEPREPVKEEPKEEVKKEPEVIKEVVKEPVDEDKLAERVVEKLRKIEESETLSKAEKEQAKEAEKLKWEREGKDKPDKWNDVVEESVRLSKKETISEVERILKERDAVKEESQKQKEEAEAKQKAGIEEISKRLQAEYDDLVRIGKMPKIVKPDDKNDRGVKARDELFATQYKVNGERIKNNQPLEPSLKVIYYEHYEKPEEQPAGADAPVAGATPVAQKQGFKPTVQTLRKMSFTEVAKEVAKNKRSQRQAK